MSQAGPSVGKVRLLELSPSSSNLLWVLRPLGTGEVETNVRLSFFREKTSGCVQETLFQIFSGDVAQNMAMACRWSFFGSDREPEPCPRLGRR